MLHLNTLFLDGSVVLGPHGNILGGQWAIVECSKLM